MANIKNLVDNHITNFVDKFNANTNTKSGIVSSVIGAGLGFYGGLHLVEFANNLEVVKQAPELLKYAGNAVALYTTMWAGTEIGHIGGNLGHVYKFLKDFDEKPLLDK